MNWPTLRESQRIERLVPPAGRVRAVLDTDTYNEIDDQYAVVYAMLSRDRIDLEANTAAPFHNARSDGPGDGMEKSYEEIGRVLERLDHPMGGFAFRGATSYLPDATTPVKSEAVDRIIDLAMSSDEPLYVLPIGAITNIASALLLEPKLVEKIVVVWLGGNQQDLARASEFNLKQDIHASRLVFDCGVPLVHVPCQRAAAMLRTTRAEIEHYVRGRGPIGDYLADIYADFVPDKVAQSKVIWDISVIAWLRNADWVPTHLVHSPILNDALTWTRDTHRHFIREATICHRDAIFRDLFEKIEAFAKS